MAGSIQAATGAATAATGQGHPPSWWRWLALTTLLAIVVTAAIVAATVLAILVALAERPASVGEALVDTVDRLAEPARFYRAGAPSRSAHLARTDGEREIRVAPQPSSSRMFIAL